MFHLMFAESYMLGFIQQVFTKSKTCLWEGIIWYYIRFCQSHGISNKPKMRTSEIGVGCYLCQSRALLKIVFFC